MKIEGDSDPVPSGVPGLDHVLRGGYAANRSHLVEGRPGSGKTTLGLQFLMEGVRLGERCLYITLSESKRELQSVAERHGWDLSGIEIFELIPPELSLDPSQHQNLVHSSELELGETVQLALAEVERLGPSRLVFDSLSEIRLLSQGSLRYRRQVQALKSFFLLKGITVLLLDDLTAGSEDLSLHSLSHAVIELEQMAPLYGGERRRLRVIKMRGVQIRGGFHDYVIRPGGLEVFPRLVAADHHTSRRPKIMTSGTGMDLLLGGGLDTGTSALLMGPSGTGKSTIAQAFATNAAMEGERTYFILFDETVENFLARAGGMQRDLRPAVENGLILVDQVDPAEISPGELAARIRHAVEVNTVRTVVIDSLTGYLSSMMEEQPLILQMHEILTYLNQQGVLTILLLANHGLIGQMTAPVDLTYLSDTIVLLRFFESNGRIRRAMSVIKKRIGRHEDTIREFQITGDGLLVGEPLENFRGVLTGVPTYEGREASLMPTERL